MLGNWVHGCDLLQIRYQAYLYVCLYVTVMRSILSRNLRENVCNFVWLKNITEYSLKSPSSSSSVVTWLESIEGVWLDFFFFLSSWPPPPPLSSSNFAKYSAEYSTKSGGLLTRTETVKSRRRFVNSGRISRRLLMMMMVIMVSNCREDKTVKMPMRIKTEWFCCSTTRRGHERQSRTRMK